MLPLNSIDVSDDDDSRNREVIVAHTAVSNLKVIKLSCLCEFGTMLYVDFRRMHA